MASPIRPDTFRVAKRNRRPQLTDDERRALVMAIKNLRHRFGTYRALGTAMGVPQHTLNAIANGKGFGSMRIALEVARVAGVPVETILAPTIVPIERCGTCGRPREDSSRRTSTPP